MFIYEMKNILADGKPVNGMIIKSTVGAYELIPADDGDKCALIYVSKEGDEPTINYLAEYEMKRNDGDEKPEDVKILAYQGKLELSEDEAYEGLIFKPILDTNYIAEVQEGESYIIIAEKKNGEYLEAPEIKSGKKSAGQEGNEEDPEEP